MPPCRGKSAVLGVGGAGSAADLMCTFSLCLPVAEGPPHLGVPPALAMLT